MPIKTVALYMRKSRGDSEEVLRKHRVVLISLCEANSWQYEEYAEIGSGDALKNRLKMQKLLYDIKSNKFDAVFVHDYDRLGRGDLSDQDTIYKTLKMTDTKIITANPFQIYDLRNEQDEQHTDFYSFIARQEYKMIKKRLKQGKVVGAKLGKWTNGTPPYPYYYDRNTKILRVDQTKLRVYRYIIEEFLKGASYKELADQLNNEKVKSPRNKTWQDTTIKRILLDEIHLGKIIYQKTKYQPRFDGGKHYLIEELPREQWIISDGTHVPVKTYEEHEQILLRVNNHRIKKKSRYPLSGLLVCGLCHHNLSFNRKPGKVVIKSCTHKKIDGSYCENKGSNVNLLMDELNRQISKYFIFLKQKAKTSSVEHRREHLKKSLNQIEEEIKNNKNILERVQEAYEKGAYNIETFINKQNNILIKIDGLAQQRGLIKKRLDQLDYKIIMKEILESEKVFKRVKAGKLTYKEMNDFYATIVEKVEWSRRLDNEIEINISLNHSTT